MAQAETSGGGGVSRHPFWLEIGRQRLYAEWLRPETGAAHQRPGDPGGARLPLVFLHEGLGSISQWTARKVDFPSLLVKMTGRPGLLFDRLGYGRSDPMPLPRPLRYLWAEAETMLPAVLDQCGIGRAILFGHSDGGSIALLFGARFPDRTAALVAEAAHIFVEPAALAGIRRAREAFHAPGNRWRPALHRHHGAKTQAMFDAWAETWLSPAFSAAFDMRDALPSITAPLLAIQGAADEYATPAHLDAIADGVSGRAERWLVPGAGHSAHFDAAEALADRITAFLDGCVPEA